MKSYILIKIIDTTKNQILNLIAALGAHFCCYLNESYDIVLTWLLRIFLTLSVLHCKVFAHLCRSDSNLEVSLCIQGSRGNLDGQ